MPDKPSVYKPWLADTRYSCLFINCQRVFPLQAQVTGPGCVLVQIAISGANPSEIPDALTAYGKDRAAYGKKRAMQLALDFYNRCPLARDHGMILEAPYWQIRPTEVGEGFVGYWISFMTQEADQSAHKSSGGNQ